MEEETQNGVGVVGHVVDETVDQGVRQERTPTQDEERHHYGQHCYDPLQKQCFYHKNPIR